MEIIRLTAKWCGPCKTYAPIFDKWAAANPDVDAVTYDLETTIIEKAWDIKSIPATIVVDKDGKILEKRVGILTEADLDKLLKTTSYAKNDEERKNDEEETNDEKEG